MNLKIAVMYLNLVATSGAATFALLEAEGGQQLYATFAAMMFFCVFLYATAMIASDRIVEAIRQ